MRGKRGAGAGISAFAGVPPQRRASRLSGGVAMPIAASTRGAIRGMKGSRPVATIRTASSPTQRTRARFGVGPSVLISFQGAWPTMYWLVSASSRQRALERPAEGEVRHGRAVVLHRFRGGSGQRVVAAPLVGGRPAVEGAPREGHQPAHGVAEVVREVAVVAVDEGFVREAGVLAEDHLAQQEVADAVAAEAVDQLVRTDDVAGRLRDLAAVALPPAVRPRRCWEAADRPTSGTPASRRCAGGGCPCPRAAAGRRRGPRACRRDGSSSEPNPRALM